jgi:putative ABC transport system substrate-binding protein
VIGRRALVAASLAALAAPLATAPLLPSYAQQPRKTARVGFVEAGARSVNGHFFDNFRQGLREHGWVEGQNVAVLDRWAEGQVERFPAIIDELIRLDIQVIVQASTPGALAAKNATKTVPIVFVGVDDPVGAGLVSNLAHPGANITGFSLGAEEGLSGKWLELLKEVAPDVSRASVLYTSTRPGLEHRLREIVEAGERSKIAVKAYRADELSDLASAFSGMQGDASQGLIVLTDPFTLRNRSQIVALALGQRLPAIFGFSEFARAGGLIAYGASVPDMFRRSADYVDRILKGESPAVLPVQQPTKFELIINLATARALDLAIPPVLLANADEVIE